MLNRFLASLINWFPVIWFVNIIFVFMNKAPLGNKVFGGEWFEGKGLGERIVFGLLTLVIFATVIGFLVNIYFWATNKESLPVMLNKAIFK